MGKEFHFQAPTKSSKGYLINPECTRMGDRHAIFVIYTITLIMAIVAVIYG